jgi:D-serine deaminase-like pyridoxal phosphate-dependent protein
MNRCGVAPGEATLELARTVTSNDGLRFDGLQGFEGHLVMMTDAQQRDPQTSEALESLIETRRMLEADGIEVNIVSSSGTGTYDVTGSTEGIDEVQVGTYALMDHVYKIIRPEFQIARRVLATIISARPGRAIADVGLKGLGTDFGPPVIDGQDEATVAYVSEEHLLIDGLNAKVGDRIRVIPSHGCTTSNLYRRMWITRNEVVEDCWAIEASGALE